MPAQPPPEVEQCLVDGAQRLGNTLRVLEWPNGGRDAPCHEVNAIINIAYFLGRTSPPYLVYAEGTVADRGRIDLIGFNGKIAIALEAKGFGAINRQSTGVLDDLERLKRFSPSPSEVAGNGKATDWWNAAKSRWGLLIISSFRGVAVKDAWLTETEDSMRTAMEAYAPAERPHEVDGKASGFLALHRALQGVHRVAAQITDAKHWNSGEGWLLWAALPLPAKQQPPQSSHVRFG